MALTFKLNKTVPLKYQLDLHSSLPSYPTRQDFLFDVLSYLIRVAESKSKDWDSSSIKFSSKTLKYVFGDRLTPEFLEKLKPIMKVLIEDGTLTKTGESLVISESTFSDFYTILQAN